MSALRKIALANSKNRAVAKPDPLPKHFGTLEEAGLFWNTHDSAN
jgi:hypothetical protein